MCTVSIVPRGSDGVRVICNRDERLERPAAVGPRVWTIGERRMMFPTDPRSGGTWIGANDKGLVAVLLNHNSRGRATAPGRLSRGVVVPRLLQRESISTALREAEHLDIGLFGPFRVVLIQSRQLALFSSAEGSDRRLLDSPAMLTSSSLGDDIVDPPRRLLFEQIVANNRDHLAGQFHFHRHQWPHRPDVSVRMRRVDAATVSRTTIDLDGRHVQLGYEPLC